MYVGDKTTCTEAPEGIPTLNASVDNGLLYIKCYITFEYNNNYVSSYDASKLKTHSECVRRRHYSLCSSCSSLL